MAPNKRVVLLPIAEENEPNSPTEEKTSTFNGRNFEDHGTFPQSFEYINREKELSQDDEISRPRIVLTGLRRSGKTSVARVVFQKMQPNETLFLETNTTTIKESICNSPFVDFELWDLPGHVTSSCGFENGEIDIVGRGAIIFLIDAQDEDNIDAMTSLHETICRAYKFNPNLRFEVFIHKTDGLTEDQKIEAQRDIQQRTIDDLSELSFCNDVQLNFHLTSVYDHSIFEAFSKVFQRLTTHLPFIENLLNILISNSAIEKAFLYDVVSKMFIATDSSPVDMQSYELCCDMIDLVLDISSIYGMNEEDGETFDEESSCFIKLNNGTVLYLLEVGRRLAAVCILREENFERRGVVSYNVSCFRNAIQDLLKLMENKNSDSHIDEKSSITSTDLNYDENKTTSQSEEQ